MNIDSLIDVIHDTVNTHALEQPGDYARWLWQSSGEQKRDLGSNEYGCADAANILYTIGRFPSEQRQRDACVAQLQKFQDPETGLFHEVTHYPFHSTAHCIGALELFDARPLYPITAMQPYKQKDKLCEFLSSLDWARDPWDESHKGAGLFAALVMAEDVSREWQDCYFDWLDSEADPETGLLRKGCIDTEGSAPLFHHMAGSFHYAFNYEYARRPMPYPEKVIDTMLQLGKEYDWSDSIGFTQIDWVFLLTRASRQTPHRHREIKEMLSDFAQRYITWLNALDYKTHDTFNDLHALFGTVCCLAELQTALPGELRTTKPLKLVLDRRPFI